MKIINCSNFIKENIDNELEIIEYVKELYDEYMTNLFNDITDKYNFASKQVTSEQKNKYNEIVNKLIDLTVEIITDNIEESDNDLIKVNDTVYDNNNNDEYIVSWFGEDNMFYDNNKQKYISLNDVHK